MGFTIDQPSGSSPTPAVGTEDKPELELYETQVRRSRRPGDPDLWLRSILKAASREGSSTAETQGASKTTCAQVRQRVG